MREWTCKNGSCRNVTSPGRFRCRSCEAGLFDTPADPIVRATDRETSRAAAASVDISTREGEVLNALRLLVVASHTGDIQRCLADYGMNRERNAISRRLTSLVRRGLVSDTGLKPGPVGRHCTAYSLTDAGRVIASAQLRRSA